MRNVQTNAVEKINTHFRSITLVPKYHHLRYNVVTDRRARQNTDNIMRDRGNPRIHTNSCSSQELETECYVVHIFTVPFLLIYKFFNCLQVIDILSFVIKDGVSFSPHLSNTSTIDNNL